MNRIIFSLFAFAFVQLVSSQDACLNAQTALATNTGCVAAFATATDTSAICMGACRDLFDDIIDNCDAGTATAYSTVISTLCNGNTGDGCTTAQTALATNTGCVSAFATATDASAVCMGTCRDLFNDIISSCDAATGAVYSTVIGTLCSNTNPAACATAISGISATCLGTLNNADTAACSGTCATQLSAAVSACGTGGDQQTQLIVSAYNSVCGEGAACTAAQVAINADTTCQSNDPGVVCSGNCRTLFNNFINSCPADDPVVIGVSQAYNTLCGSGSMLKASGVITLLVVAICALIF